MRVNIEDEQQALMVCKRVAYRLIQIELRRAGLSYGADARPVLVALAERLLVTGFVTTSYLVLGAAYYAGSPAKLAEIWGLESKPRNVNTGPQKTLWRRI